MYLIITNYGELSIMIIKANIFGYDIELDLSNNLTLVNGDSGGKKL